MAFSVVGSCIKPWPLRGWGTVSDASEQKALLNQPVEVRVGPRVLGSFKVKSPGGLVLFKSSFSQGFLIPASLNRPLPVAENCFGTFSFSFLLFL